MISQVTGSPDVQNVAPTIDSRKAAQARTALPIQDTVKISAAALQALKAKPAESAETLDQTMHEANAGDPIALAKLAKII